MEVLLTYGQLFATFFIIGLFGFGGGYGMVSLIQTKVVPVWMSSAEFTDILAVSQMTPGPIGINTATYCGYMACKDYGAACAVVGSALATLALVLPSVILMTMIARMFLKHMKSPAMTAVFSGLRPAVVGMMAAATLLLCNSDNFSTPSDTWRFCISIFIALSTWLGVAVLKISPVTMIVMSAFAGLLLLY